MNFKFDDTNNSGIKFVDGKWIVECPYCKKNCDVGFSDNFHEKEDWWFAECDDCETNIDWWTNRK